VSQGKGAAVTAAPEFPIVLAAIEEHEGTSKWKIADAILLELGAPVSSVSNDGAAEKMSRFLTDRGHPDWAARTILKMRATAHAFRPAAARQACSFETHSEAASPEMLDEAIRRNGGKLPTRDFVRKMRREMREQEEAAERKREADRRRRAEETERRAHEKARAARDERERAQAQERARKAEQRRLALEREHQEAERKRDERRRREADAKAERLARELEDRDVAEALARNQSTGALRITNAVHEKAAARRRKVRVENEHRRNAEGLPLPAFVPKMVGELDAWVIALRAVSDEDLAGLPADDRFVTQLSNIVEDLVEEAMRWDTVLGEAPVARRPDLEVIEGQAAESA
jgi:hypothetical protein